MLGEEPEASPSGALVSLPEGSEWQLILHASNQVVLYHPTSHALTVQRHNAPPGVAEVVRRLHAGERCPFCHRPMAEEDEMSSVDFDEEIDREMDEFPTSRAANYFQLLQVANESSVPPTPRSPSPVMPLDASSSRTSAEDGFPTDNMAEGYFKAFFREECRLGMGANGSVFLCEHVLNGNSLGRFAVKKIAVGRSHSYLLNILREVRLLEQLHHPNIITYHHAWLELSQFSSFGPKWAEGGSLDDFIDARLGRSTGPPMPPFFTEASSPVSDPAFEPSSTPFSRGARIRAFRAMQHASPEDRARLRRELSLSNAAGQSPRENNPGTWLAVHLLSAEEAKALFSDVVSGLAFLHDRSILHLDLKPGNVLLTWEQGKLVPTAMLSDFGTSQDMLNSRARSGNTGTLEYTSPESLPSPTTGLLSQLDSKSDMWSLGMILHKLLFFRLPYQYASDNTDQDSKRDGKATADALEREVLNYPGFKSTPSVVSMFESRHLPRAFLILLEGLLNVNPGGRPSSDRVLSAIREGRLDPVPPTFRRAADKTSLIPIRRTPPSEQTPTPTPPPADDTSRETTIRSPLALNDIPPVAATEKAADGPSDSGPHPLPSPVDSSGRLSPVRHTGHRRGATRVVVVRTLKSSLLVAKVWTLSGIHNTSTFSLTLRGLALATAIVDTWFDDLRISVLLGILHAGLLFVMD
ncbi:putative serine/threonine-protein kinase iks1 [Steccherinum ochraceum]|uniref:Putative serine/threonine-protein kinase iks1 n=1 Tax=Steccherinum ochraceum TaxID=92696 RepID=A0A4R0RDZ4_9APHY|nr:putative serine/threonine-protein kinase iks1 [Steccherinum ochraceum]